MKVLKEFLKSRWGLLILLILLSIISAKTLQSSKYIIGWDNFSTSLDLSINLPRNLFATWREYRGFGVPSDSEVVDTFRQIILLIISPLANQRVLDQIYTLANLYLGVIGTYFLAKTLLKKLPNNNSFIVEVASLLGSLFYLFNLNTLGTFYFPMPMYFIRYGILPWLVLFFINILNSDKIKPLALLSFMVATLLISASYLTATVFFTVLLTLVIITISHISNLKRGLLLILLFLLLNSYWILPFTNYSIKKSKIVPLASTFVEVNEIQLNEAPDHFNLDKLLTFYPNFFYTQAKTISSNENVYLHPSVNKFNDSTLHKIFNLVFSSLLLLGSVLILLKPNRKLIWIPILILSSLFMVRKSYPPFGFLYDLIGNYIPLFKVVFRFSDTKFFNLLSLTGSVAASYLIFSALNSLNRSQFKNHLVKVFSIGLIFFHLVGGILVYTSFFNGNLISTLMYNEIPKAYFDIAKTINSDPENVRVLHLPFEITSYWKPYKWGYVGSSFFNFLINKPLFDRTFEPGSQENNNFDLTLLNSINNAQNISDESIIDSRAKAMYSLLINAGVKYLIWDESVDPTVIAKDTEYWGIFPMESTEKILTSLENQNLIFLANSYEIPTYQGDTILPESSDIKLYIVKGELEKPREIQLANSNSGSTLLDHFTEQGKNFIETDTGKIIPFQDNYLIQKTTDSFEFSVPQEIKEVLLEKAVTSSQQSPKAIDVFLRKDNDFVYIGLKYKKFPLKILEDQPESEVKVPLNLLKANQTENVSNFSSDWHTLPYSDISPYRIAIQDTVFPLPSNIKDYYEYATTVLSTSPSISVELLSPKQVLIIDLSEIKETEDPNCYSDKSNGYNYDLKHTSTSLNLTTVSGTTCLTSYLPEFPPNSHFEAEVDYNLTSSPVSLTELKSPSFFQKTISRLFSNLETANYLTFCVIDFVNGGCVNNHEVLPYNKSSAAIPGTSLINEPPQFLIALPSINNQSNTLSISKLTLTPFSSIFKSEAEVNFDNTPTQIKLDGNTFTLHIPKILSSSSYYFNARNDLPKVYNQVCENEEGVRFPKIFNSQFFQYAQNCQAGSYVELPFGSDNFYYWSLNYNLLSGKYPKFILKDNNNSYKDEYLSINQGYPNIKEFRNLQIGDPLVLFDQRKVYENLIKDKLANLNYINSYTFIPSQPGVNDKESKLFTIFHQSENQGILSIKNFSIVQLPPEWQNISIDPQIINPELKIIESKSAKILPSLWKITPTLKNIDNLSTDVVALDQGFDEDWKLYRTNSVIGALFGVNEVKGEHLRLNGFSNAWILTENKEDTVYLALYTPERLALIGWAITLISVFIPLYLSITFLIKRYTNQLN